MRRAFLPGCHPESRRMKNKMERVKFVSKKLVATFSNPLKDNLLDNQEIEVRFDPLLEHQSVFNPDLKDKISILFPETDYEYLEKVVGETRNKCFLCDGKWEHTTPRYPEEFIPGGRLIKNETVLFPNLFPLFGYHAVIMLGEKHFRTLDDFPPSLFLDAFDVSVEFMRRCFEHDPAVKYFTINANYLFPAGSSVVHPHLQIIGGRLPTTHQKLLIDRSQIYFEKNGSIYWDDLVRSEKEIGRRWIAEVSGIHWLTPYSPVGQNEVQAIWPGKRHFLEWDREDMKAIAGGISEILKTYREMKFSTFNFSIYSGALDGSDKSFRCMMRLITRQNVVPNHRTDDYYFQKLLGNEIILITPENLAATLSARFETLIIQ